MASPISDHVDLRTYIRSFVRMSQSDNFSVAMKAALNALLPAFERNLLQAKDRKLRWFAVVNSIFSFCFYQWASSLPSYNKKAVFFWPFQFYHCDFMVPVIKRLIKDGITVEVQVFRQNLVPYLAERGVASNKIQFSRSRLPLHCSLVNMLQMLNLIWHVLFGYNSKFRSTFYRSLLNLNTISKTRSAIQIVADSDFPQYHMVGYDMSVLGRVIIDQTNRLGIPSGRIQNGAPNYLTAGYSQCQELFFWDKVSANVYQQLGYQGKVNIVGNNKLYEKLKTGISSTWQNFLSENLAGYQYLIFVAFSGPGHNTSVEGHIQSVEILKNIMLAVDTNYYFIIKLHPKDHIKYYDNIKNLSNVKLINHHGNGLKPDALDLLITCSGIITGASSVVLDAFQLGKPIISIDPLNELSHFEFLKHPSVHLAKEQAEIKFDWIKAIFELPDKRRPEPHIISPAEKIASLVKRRFESQNISKLDVQTSTK